MWGLGFRDYFVQLVLVACQCEAPEVHEAGDANPRAKLESTARSSPRTGDEVSDGSTHEGLQCSYTGIQGSALASDDVFEAVLRTRKQLSAQLT